MADDTIIRLSNATVDLSAVSTDPSGDGQSLYVVSSGDLARVVEFVLRPSADIGVSSPLRLRFNFRAPALSGGSLTQILTPSYFDNLDGMRAELGYAIRPTLPSGAARGVCYMGVEGAVYSLNVITAHDVLGVTCDVDVIGMVVNP